jgi:cell division protein FtsZ
VQQPEARRPASTLFGSLLGRRAPKPAEDPAPAPQASEQPRLHGPERDERSATSSHDDDLLDIPAFLRRQAN